MAFIWSVLILLCVLMYVVLDGYDLGIGIATLFERDARRRHEMLELVALAWDGNETWLVLAGVALWAGFPLAFGTILPHAFLPLIVMLFALIVRGVSVEMVSQRPSAPGWAQAFGIGVPVRAGGLVYLMAVAVAGAAVAAVTLRPASRYDALPLCGLAITVVATFLAVVVARYPVLVPPGLTVGNAASPGSTFDFIAVGIGLNVPLVLFYNWYAHYAFHGKEASGAGPAARGIPPVQDAQPGSVSPSQEASLSMISEPRPLRAARRILVQTLLIIAGTIGPYLPHFLSNAAFAGY